MAKVYFRYAAMNAGKSTQLLQVRHNYHERGQRTYLLKPSTDDRDGVFTIRPRIGLVAEVDDLLMPDSDPLRMVRERASNVHCILVDEAQFLSGLQVDRLCVVADDLNIPVMCYGLRTDFRGQLFSGSLALLAFADDIEEIKTICWCGRKATMNARIVAGHVVLEGPQILVGGNESYVALCRKHWRNDNLGSQSDR